MSNYIEEIEVYSKKYDITGKVTKIGGISTKLTFPYRGQECEMGISNYLLNDTYQNYCEKIIDTYVEELKAKNNRTTQLHYWYVDSNLQGHGVVSGHPRLNDAGGCDTSTVQQIILNKEQEELLIKTCNTDYHCPLAYCDFEKQKENKDLIPEYEWIYANHKDKRDFPETEEGKVLLVLSNFDVYYFHSLYCKYPGEKDPVPFHSSTHIGMIQDSFLIRVPEHPEIDLRYFPHYQFIEFYSEVTDGMPLFLENIGDLPLYAKTTGGLIKLGPGERKEVSKDNCTNDKVHLAGGDLYPAQILE